MVYVTEGALQRACIKRGEQDGWLAYKFASPSHRGVPDCVFIKKGHTVWVEFKNPNGKGKLSELQSVTINRMRQHGADVHICSSMEQFLHVIH